MTTTKTKIALLLFSIFPAISIIAQSDLESWHEVDLNFDMGSKTDLYWTHEIRLDNNSSEIKKYQSEAGIDYRLVKRVTVSAGYRYARFYDNGYYHNEHRGIALCKYAPRFQRFVLELQTRTEYIARAADGYIYKEELVWRNKATLNYKWPTQPITLFASYEHFSLLTPQATVDKFRVLTGGKFQFNKKLAITAFWGIQEPFGQKMNVTYIVGWKAVYNLYKASKRKSKSDNE
ncbi:MAG: DUF2490 domain-containing protein [Bacteroidales bacterium]